MGTTNACSLLPSTRCSGRFADSKRAFFFSLHCKISDSDFALLKLVTEPDSLLLEDQRSETRSEGHAKTTFLFIVSSLYLYRGTLSVSGIA